MGTNRHPRACSGAQGPPPHLGAAIPCRTGLASGMGHERRE